MFQQPLVSYPFGRIPNDSAPIGTVPQDAEGFRTLPIVSERRESHTLTVREVARMFEAAGVARTERSIINWCQPNKLGVPRLDAYFDPNERRYFITPQSVELAIKEEQAKATRVSGLAESGGTIPKAAESHPDNSNSSSIIDPVEIAELKRENMNLKITDRFKDHAIAQYEKDRSQFALERNDYIEQLMACNRQIGTLETRLLQLGAPGDANAAEAAEKE